MNMLDACIAFLQRLVQTPSLPGEEAAIAALVKAEMERLGYDDVFVDEAGNVIGCIRGRGEAPPIMFNTHLDHVDPGDADGWRFPPYGGEIHEEAVWGRGTVDIKGPLAAQVHGVARLKTDSTPPPGDVYVSAVVQEEIGGLGARHLLTHLQPPFIVVGEPSRNELRRGHRGRTEVVLHVRGRSAHASMPAAGVNPLFAAARFLLALERLPMPTHPDLGTSSAVPTLIRTDQTSRNVIPGELWLTIDWRTTPGESAESICNRLRPLAEEATHAVPGAEAEIIVPTQEVASYTGLRMHLPAENPAFVLPSDHVALRTAAQVLRSALGAEPPVGVWQFATDGGHFAQAGLTVIGFGPGDDRLAHTNREHIRIAEIETALHANAALAREWGASLRA
nr:M20/M25/M40 family metallo-hydrolase [Ardenticatena sp.]